MKRPGRLTPAQRQRERKRAAELLQRAQALREEADRCERAGQTLLLFLDEMERLDAGYPVILPRDIDVHLPGTEERPKMGTMTPDWALKIAKTMSGKKRAPEVDALYAAGLTPASAAFVLNEELTARKTPPETPITRDILKQRWASKEEQRRPMPRVWAEILESHGVPLKVWKKIV